ncbi:DUF6081 family protein [Microlunatus speluncae]|uniref:DUF6081 family protein n=1 Tax=Microlunatus speluncae TaxID=2594267 RepID=UPI00126612EC|nr:DUF6081 family protein [Microlunatus speluncae]
MPTDEGFTTYDELRGPELDPARWQPMPMPRPGGQVHLPIDPEARVTVGEGEVRVTIPRFSLADDEFQTGDSPKYLIFSTGRFDLPPDRPVTFAVELAIKNLGGDPADYRRAMAAFHVFDVEESRRVFAVCGTSTRVLALHEQLGAWGAADPFYHVIESPYEDFDDDFTRLRTCEITLDAANSTATWTVDGQVIFRAEGTLIPQRLCLGFGIWTMLPIRNGRSRSLSDQGLDARWRDFRVRGITT